jgi:hypothetical protein
LFPKPPNSVAAALDPSVPLMAKPVKCYNHKTKDSRFSKMEDSLIAKAVSVFVAPPVMSPVVVAPEPVGKHVATVKASPMRGLLQRGFLGPSLSTVSSLTMVVKEDGEERSCPSLLGGSSSGIPNVGKGDDLRLTGLIQSQKWPIGFGPSSELVVWDQGDDFWDEVDGEFPYPLGVFPPAMPLDWALGYDEDFCPVKGGSCEGDEDLSLALLLNTKEDLSRRLRVLSLSLEVVESVGT